jgi:hypothetical protein
VAKVPELIDCAQIDFEQINCAIERYEHDFDTTTSSRLVSPTKSDKKMRSIK